MTGKKDYGPIQEKLNADKKTSRSYTMFYHAIKTDSVRYRYPLVLDTFMRFAKFDSYEKLKKLKTDDLQDILEDWIMTKSKLARGSVASEFAPVKLFLEMNRIVFFKTPIVKLFPKDKHIKSGKVPYTTEEIDRMLESTSIWRTKALVLFFTSTGARPGALRDEDGYLQLKHLTEMPNGCLHILIYAGTDEEYHAFLTPEANLALQKYLSYRESKGEILTPESPVFAYVSGKGPMSSHSASEILCNLLKKADVKRTKVRAHRFDKAVIYGFRKRLNGKLKIDSEINSNIAEKLMAHKNGLDGVYFQPSRDECFAEFRKAIYEITISKESKLLVENLKLKEKIQSNTKEEVLEVFEMMDINIDDLKEFVRQKNKDRKFK